MLQITKVLDDYVVGQDQAKRVLSVAVFNHYTRVQANLERGTSSSSSSSTGNEVNESPSEHLCHHHINEEEVDTQKEQDRYYRTSFWRSDELQTTGEQKTLLEKSNVLLIGPTGSGMCVCMWEEEEGARRLSLTMLQADDQMLYLSSHKQARHSSPKH